MAAKTEMTLHVMIIVKMGAPAILMLTCALYVNVIPFSLALPVQVSSFNSYFANAYHYNSAYLKYPTICL